MSVLLYRPLSPHSNQDDESYHKHNIPPGSPRGVGHQSVLPCPPSTLNQPPGQLSFLHSEAALFITLSPANSHRPDQPFASYSPHQTTASQKNPLPLSQPSFCSPSPAAPRKIPPTAAAALDTETPMIMLPATRPRATQASCRQRKSLVLMGMSMQVYPGRCFQASRKSWSSWMDACSLVGAPHPGWKLLDCKSLGRSGSGLICNFILWLSRGQEA